MTDTIDPHDPYPSLTGLADAYRAGTTKPSEIVAAHLDRITRHDPEIGAYREVYADDAMAAAKAADRAMRSGHRIGPFHGIPFALKDLFELEGRKTGWGSKALEDRVSTETGPVVRRLIAAGGIVIGKTHTVEIAFGGWGTNEHMGTPRNPWSRDEHRAPGGSSSGSAAAVAAGLAVCGVGSDTGGSVRLPAAFCGLTGLKITEGRLPLAGIMPLSPTLDTPGPIARSVVDALVMFEVMDGVEGWVMDAERADETGLFAGLKSGVAGLRLASLSDDDRARCEPGVLEQYDAALDLLRGLGAVIEPFVLPDLTEDCGRIIAIEAYAGHSAMYENIAAPMDSDVRARVLSARGVEAREYQEILAKRQRRIIEFRATMRGYDAILTPTATVAAPRLDEADPAVSAGVFTRRFNYLAMCGLSVPIGLDVKGMPIGLQVAARGGDEAMALRIGATVEHAMPALHRPDYR